MALTVKNLSKEIAQPTSVAGDSVRASEVKSKSTVEKAVVALEIYKMSYTNDARNSYMVQVPTQSYYSTYYLSWRYYDRYWDPYM